MQVVKTSEIVKMLTIPTLGEPTNGAKFQESTDLFFIKKNNKYKAIPFELQSSIVLEYSNKDWKVQLTESEDFENICLAAIKVNNKGKGFGTDVMNRILDYCDDNGYKLYLHPFPLEYVKNFNFKKALNGYFRLKDWYKSFGLVEQSDGYMVYEPS